MAGAARPDTLALSDRIGARIALRNHDQVQVVGHKAICLHRDPLAPVPLADRAGVDTVVLVREENLPWPVLRWVMWCG